MSLRPRLPRRLLEWSHRRDPALPAILGDLDEELHARARRDGPSAARRWYLREAAGLAAGRWISDLRSTFTGRSTMNDAFSSRGLRQDLGYAWRSIRRRPGFSLLTALVIGLGVGATTAVFSVMKPLMLAPLPVGAPSELVWIALQDGNDESLSDVTSRTGNLADFRRLARSFEGITGFNAFSAQTAYTLEAEGRLQRIVGYGVAPDFLEVLDVRPALGRSFSEAESTWDGPGAMVLSHGFWQRRFGGDPAVVGRTVTLNGAPTEVIGVLPASFDFGSLFTPSQEVDFLTVWEISERTDAWGNTLHMIGRLRPGVSTADAQAELDGVVAGLLEEQPDRWGLGAFVTPLQEKIAAPFRGSLFLLAGAAATVLLIVTVNVSNMLLARTPGRTREIAVRKALGASRGRLVRQLLAESTSIAIGGSLAGAVLAWAATRFVSAAAGIRVPLLDQVQVDGPALAFAAGVSILTGVVVGLVPALQVSEGDESTVLRSGGRAASATRGARRMQESLVIAEVALASVLLVTGGLLVRSFQEVMEVDLGYDPSDAVAWQLNPAGSYETNEELVAFFDAVANRVEEVPGVEAVGMIDALPLGRNRSWGFRVVGRPEDDDGLGFHPHVVRHGYFEAMDIDIVAGRALQPWDVSNATPVIVVNRSAAVDHFGGPERALGQRLVSWDGREWEVVGVAEDVLHVSPESPPGVQVYFSMAQMPDYPTIDMVVRASGPLTAVVPSVRAAVAEFDPAMPMQEFWTLEETVSKAVSARRFLLQILGAFGASALLLAGLGIYGVLAFSVAERQAEIGIRMALGASAGTVLWSVVRRTMTLAVVGIALGWIGSVGVTRLLASLLYGVGENDPVAVGGMVGVLLAVSMVAGLVPALRAARVRGVRALQAE